MVKVLGAAALVLTLAASAGARADSYDGKWLVPIAGFSVSCPAVNLQISVAGQKMRAEAGTARFTYKLFGTIAPDGTFNISSPGGQGHSKGKFSGNTLTADFTNSQCATRSGTGGRTQ